jgi:hypothetical protein
VRRPNPFQPGDLVVTSKEHLGGASAWGIPEPDREVAVVVEVFPRGSRDDGDDWRRDMVIAFWRNNAALVHAAESWLFDKWEEPR